MAGKDIYPRCAEQEAQEHRNHASENVPAGEGGHSDQTQQPDQSVFRCSKLNCSIGQWSAEADKHYSPTKATKRASREGIPYGLGGESFPSKAVPVQDGGHGSRCPRYA